MHHNQYLDEFEISDPIQDVIVEELSKIAGTTENATLYKKGILVGMLKSLVLSGTISKSRSTELFWKILEIIEPSNSES